MGEPVYFEGANRRLGPPPGAENISTLYTYSNGLCSVSCWQLSEAEIDVIRRTGRVYVSVLSGHTQPPVFVGGEEEVRSLVVDYGGVWARGERDRR